MAQKPRATTDQPVSFREDMMQLFFKSAILFLVVLVGIAFAYSQGRGNESNNSNPPLSDDMSLIYTQIYEAKKDVDVNIFESIENNMSLKIEPPEISLIKSNEYKLCYTINWSVNPDIIKSTLAKYFIVSSCSYNFRKKYYNIKKHDGVTNYSEPLFSYIMANPIKLLVNWNNSKALIDITDSHHTLVPNWDLYFEGTVKYCRSDLTKSQVSESQDISARLVFNTFKSGGTGPIIEWQDIYDRKEMGQRSIGSVGLGIDSRGGGSEYSVRGRYSQLRGEYHGAWANFEGWKIHWDFNRIYQFDTKNGDESGWYMKKNNSWVKE